MDTISRQTRAGVSALAAFTAAAVACGASSPTTSSSPTLGGGSSAAPVTLTVMNFLSWCSVSINGGAASTAASMDMPFDVGSTVTVVARPASAAFMIGPDPWFGVTQDDGGPAPGADMGTGTSETSTATVVVDGNHCVSVCCQEPGNSPIPCPAADPCPRAGRVSSSGSGGGSSSGSSASSSSGAHAGSSSGSGNGSSSGTGGGYGGGYPGY